MFSVRLTMVFGLIFGWKCQGVLEWAVELRSQGDEVHVRRQPPPAGYVPPPKPKAQHP